MGIMVLFSCVSMKEKVPEFTVADYDAMEWREKKQYVEAIRQSEPDAVNVAIMEKAIIDPEILVVEAFLIAVKANRYQSYKEDMIHFLDHPNPFIRWRALCALQELKPSSEDLDSIVKHFNDKEWLVREEAFSLVKKFPEEKKAKKYYLTILLHLNETNPDVLSSVINTLKWYEDERTYSYLMQRSYYAKDEMVLIVIIRELAEFNSKSVEKRLLALHNSHPSLVVRNEAGRLLDKYF